MISDIFVAAFGVERNTDCNIPDTCEIKFQYSGVLFICF